MKADWMIIHNDVNVISHTKRPNVIEELFICLAVSIMTSF